MNSYIDVFKALSDRSRVRALKVLLKARKELCLCETMDALKVAQYNMSRHLKELRKAGLVKENKVGRFVFYSVCEPKDRFQKKIYEAVEAMPEELFKEDNGRMKKRLALRKQGKCVVGMNGKAVK